MGIDGYWAMIVARFCVGLARGKEHLLASFGVLDKQAWLAEIPLESVVEALAW